MTSPRNAIVRPVSTRVVEEGDKTIPDQRAELRALQNLRYQRSQTEHRLDGARRVEGGPNYPGRNVAARLSSGHAVVDWSLYFGCILIAPSTRIVSPLTMGFRR